MRLVSPAVTVLAGYRVTRVWRAASECAEGGWMWAEWETWAGAWYGCAEGGGWTRERVKLLFFLYAQHSAAPNIRRRVLLAAHVDREIYVWTFYYFPNTSGNPRKRKKITPPHVNSENKKNRFYVNWNENYSKIVLRFYCVHLHIELILFINIGARCTAAQGSPTSARHSSLNQVVDVFFVKNCYTCDMFVIISVSSGKILLCKLWLVFNSTWAQHVLVLEILCIFQLHQKK